MKLEGKKTMTKKKEEEGKFLGIRLSDVIDRKN
jgi:hypothetical protein